MSLHCETCGGSSFSKAVTRGVTRRLRVVDGYCFILPESDEEEVQGDWTCLVCNSQYGSQTYFSEELTEFFEERVSDGQKSA